MQKSAEDSETKQSNNDEIDGNQIIKKARHDQDQNADKQGKNGRNIGHRDVHRGLHGIRAQPSKTKSVPAWVVRVKMKLAVLRSWKSPPPLQSPRGFHSAT